MSLNKFTDTTIKPYLKIGCSEIKCDTLEVGGQPIEDHSTANLQRRFDTTPYVIQTLSPLPSVYPVSLSANRGSGNIEDVFQSYNNGSITGITCLKKGIYSISGMLDYTSNNPNDRVELHGFIDNGNPSFVARGCNNAVSTAGGVINFYTQIFITTPPANVYFEVGSTTPSDLTIIKWDMCMSLISIQP